MDEQTPDGVVKISKIVKSKRHVQTPKEQNSTIPVSYIIDSASNLRTAGKEKTSKRMIVRESIIKIGAYSQYVFSLFIQNHISFAFKNLERKIINKFVLSFLLLN